MMDELRIVFLSIYLFNALWIRSKREPDHMCDAENTLAHYKKMLIWGKKWLNYNEMTTESALKIDLKMTGVGL